MNILLSLVLSFFTMIVLALVAWKNFPGDEKD